jgi:eukaryotic-like serine/threonine-protein kinase
MGSVYRARDLHFPNVVKSVAVKEMINHVRDPLVRQTIIQNFEREANILATLSHPSIPEIYDYFTEENRSYLVLEYIHGKDLEAVLNEVNGFLPEESVIEWTIELCGVLQYLHTHKPEPIIFRDMKPSNVMVDQNGHIVLIDFGIAKNFSEGKKGTMIGTEGYSPPEQYRGEASPQADIYALGATMHHMLTNRDPRLEPPFSFAERQIRQINSSVSPELEAVISTCLKYNPEERFSSAEQMKDAIIAAAKKTGTLPVEKLQNIPVIMEQGIKPLWKFKCEDEIRGSVEVNRGNIFVGSYDNNIYVLDAMDGKFIWKYPTKGGIVGKPSIAEGDVIFGSEDATLYAVSIKSGKLNWSFETGGPIHSSPRVAEGHVFFGSDDHFLYAINLNTYHPSWKFEASGAIRSTACVTSDYIYVGSEAGELICIDYRGQIKFRYRSKRPITSSPLVTHGFAFFASLDATFYALDAKTGFSIWRYRMGKGSISSPCANEKYVFIGSADGNIYCLDGGSAKEIWRFRTDHQVSGSPLIYKDALYCGSADGYLYCLDARSGRLRWRFGTEGPITAMPLIENDILYIGSTDHVLYAFPLQS